MVRQDVKRLIARLTRLSVAVAALLAVFAFSAPGVFWHYGTKLAVILEGAVIFALLVWLATFVSLLASREISLEERKYWAGRFLILGPLAAARYLMDSSGTRKLK
jgi:hypothetical protein